MNTASEQYKKTFKYRHLPAKVYYSKMVNNLHTKILCLIMEVTQLSIPSGERNPLYFYFFPQLLTSRSLMRHRKYNSKGDTYGDTIWIQYVWRYVETPIFYSFPSQNFETDVDLKQKTVSKLFGLSSVSVPERPKKIKR